MTIKRLLLASAMMSLAACSPDTGAGPGGPSVFDPIPPEDITWTDDTPIAEVPDAWRARVAGERLAAAGDEGAVPAEEVVWADDGPLEDVPEIWRERVALERAAAEGEDEEFEGIEEGAALPSQDPRATTAKTIKKTVEAAAELVKSAKAVAPSEGSRRRQRRGPPADGQTEKRVDMILTTSKLSDKAGRPLRRGGVVSVPERRVESLTNQGRVRAGSLEALEIAERRYGKFDLA